MASELFLRIEVYLGDGTGKLTNLPAGAIDTTGNSLPYTMAQLDGSSIVDLAVGGALNYCPGTVSSVELHRAVGDGTFDGEGSAYTQYYSPTNGTADVSPVIAAGDRDGDCKTDLVAHMASTLAMRF